MWHACMHALIDVVPPNNIGLAISGTRATKKKLKKKRKESNLFILNHLNDLYSIVRDQETI